MEFCTIDNVFKIKSINTLFTRNYADDYFFPGENHAFWEMIYVEKGSLTVSEDEKVYVLTEGQAVFHAPLEFHRFWAKRSEHAIFKILSFDLECDIEHNLSKGVFDLEMNLRNMFMDTCLQIYNSYPAVGTATRNDEASVTDKMLAVKKLETFLLSLISHSNPSKTQDYSAPSKRYRETVIYMNQRVGNSLTLEQIAEDMHMSVSYLKKLFNTYAGCGVMHYFTRLKITVCLSYLKNGYSISEVSEMFGFSSPNYFSAVFKREMGMLPTEYRSKKF